jgi:succinate dehydrogenase/fumarate reductase cytochrome b subunit
MKNTNTTQSYKTVIHYMEYLLKSINTYVFTTFIVFHIEQANKGAIHTDFIRRVSSTTTNKSVHINFLKEFRHKPTYCMTNNIIYTSCRIYQPYMTRAVFAIQKSLGIFPCIFISLLKLKFSPFLVISSGFCATILVICATRRIRADILYGN